MENGTIPPVISKIKNDKKGLTYFKHGLYLLQDPVLKADIIDTGR